MKTKRCTKCGETKPLTEFHRNKSRKDGLADWCKKCAAECGREYRKANLERAAARMRKYRKANPEKVAARMRKYHEEHKEEIAESKRRRRQKNPERAKAKNRRDRRRRRARKANAEGSFTTAEFKVVIGFYALIARPNGCLWPDDGTECRGILTPDHIVPLSRGGSNDISNIQPLCQRHNDMKGTKTIDYRP